MGVHFSVIIPSYKRKLFLLQCIQSLIGQDFPADLYEIIIVDDGSLLDSQEEVPEYRQLVYVKGPGRGVSAARNIGIALARGKYIAFLDDDCYVASNWLRAFEKAFTAEPDCVGFGGTVFGSPEGSFIPRYLDYREFLRRPVINTDTGEITNIITCNACFLKEALEIVGGIYVPTLSDGRDLTVALGLADVDDIDLTFRLTRQGYKVGYASEAVVFHHHRSSLRDFIKQNIRYGQNAYLHCELRQRPPIEIGNPDATFLSLSRDLLRLCRVELPEHFRKGQEDRLSIVNTLIYLCLDIIRRVSYLVGIWSANKRLRKVHWL